MAEELETRVDDVEDVEETPSGDDGNSGDAGAAKPEEPFLSVNDRTRYKTREDAVRGFNEAGQRIAQLSSWEKEAKAYGIADPRHLKPLFDELLELRKTKAGLEKEGAKGGVKQPTHTDSEASLSAEELKARNYLKKVLPEIGYVPKEELTSLVEKLQQQVEELKSGQSSGREQYFRDQEASARDKVGSWLTEGGFEDDTDGTKLRVVGTLIKDWINSDDALVERWSQGGSEATKLIREGFDQAMKALGWAPTKKDAKGAAYAASKGKAVAGNNKLPATGSGKNAAAAGDGKKKLANGQTDHIGSAHEKAWDLFHKMSGAAE